MLLVPLPFIIVLFLIVFGIRFWRSARDRGDDPVWFVILMSLYGLQSLLVGVRWAYDRLDVIPVMATVAACLPPVAYFAFRGLVNGQSRLQSRDLPHGLWPLLTGLSLLVWRDVTGLLVIVDFAAYGAALLWIARGGPDRLAASRLDGVLNSYVALHITGWTLLASAISDILISLDFDYFGGRHSAMVVSTGTTLCLILFSVAAAFSDPAQKAAAEDVEPEPILSKLDADRQDPSKEDQEIASALDLLMQDAGLHRDVELNLSRIARRLHMPTRSISRAINRTHGMSVSQYVNGFRVRDAQRLLEQTDRSVIQIAFEAGFMTKSNFNREFLRSTGASPTDWRRRHAAKKA